MSRPIIVCDQLGKYYNLGVNHTKRLSGSPPSLRESISDRLRAAREFIRGRRREKSNNHEFWALKDVSFEVARGDVVGIVGRNGAGKSTLLKILSRIVDPTTGTARLRGRLASLLEVGTGFHPELTGRENIYLNGAILGMKKAEIDRKFDDIVAFSEIEKFLDTPVKRYSSGMYVRLAFAVAAHLEPEILIVDEVLAVGDFAFQKKCLGKMHDVATGDGRTILFVSHNMGALAQLCNRGILLEKGMVTMSGSIEDVTKTYLASAKGQTQARSRFPIEPQRQVQWLSAEVLHEDDTPGTEFGADEPIKIRLGLAIRKSIHLTVTFSLFTHDGIRVLFCDARDGDSSIVERLGEGEHTFQIRIPPRLLASTTYTIEIATWPVLSFDPLATDHDTRSGFAEFTIRDLTGVYQNRPGMLGLMLPWEHQCHDVLESGIVA
jgi:lipopolysaccharide transport system ATP-binding protein